MFAQPRLAADKQPTSRRQADDKQMTSKPLAEREEGPRRTQSNETCSRERTFKCSVRTAPGAGCITLSEASRRKPTNQPI